MNDPRTPLILVLLLWFADSSLGADGALYTNNFNQVQAGPVPEDFLVLNGEFTVRKEGEQGWLELPGAPLDTFGLLFGPTFSPKADPGVSVRADFQASARGRRFPAFAVGADGGGGFKLQASPAKQHLELFRGETLLVSQPLEWKSETWITLRLDVARRGESWLIRGKVWTRGQPEPASWQIEQTSKDEPFSGRASIWGLPFSGRPILFDNLGVDRAKTD